MTALSRNGRTVSTTQLLTYGAPLLLTALSAADAVLDFSSRWAGWPFLISLFLIGMPHGAADLLVSARLGRGDGWPSALAHFTPYVLVLALCAVAVALAPGIALIAFAAVTFLHFSAADYQELKRRAGEASTHLLASASGRAAVVLGLPFLCSAGPSVGLLNRLLGILGSESRIDDMEQARLVAGTAVGLGLLAMLASWSDRLVRGLAVNRRDVLTEMVETGGLCVGLATLHPLFAMGVYFLAWHSLRHLRELCGFLWPHEDFEEPPRFLRGIARVHLRSLPLLLPTVVIFAGLAVALGEPWDVTGMSLLVVVIFVAVTLPHHLQIQQMFASDASNRTKGLGAASGQALTARTRRGLEGAWPRASFYDRPPTLPPVAPVGAPRR